MRSSNLMNFYIEHLPILELFDRRTFEIVKKNSLGFLSISFKAAKKTHTINKLIKFGKKAKDF